MVLSEKVQDSYKWNNRTGHINPCSCPRGRPQLTIWSVCECMYAVRVRVCTCMSLCVYKEPMPSTDPPPIIFSDSKQQRFLLFFLTCFLSSNSSRGYGTKEIERVRNSAKKKEEKKERYKDRETTKKESERETFKTFKPQYAIWHGHLTTTVKMM